jgi:hypothetical protein
MLKKWISLAFILLVAAAIVVAGYRYWKHAQVHPNTEDAYVSGDVFSVASRIPGTLLTVEGASLPHHALGGKTADLPDALHHSVQRIADHDDDCVGRGPLDLPGHGADDPGIGGQQIIPAHTRFSGDPGGNNDDFGIFGGRVIIGAG